MKRVKSDPSMIELRITDDVARGALSVWRETAPRSVALAGGRTPRRLYELLVSEPGVDEVEFYFGDERCVPLDHPDSNFRLAYEALLSKIEARAYPMQGCDAAAYAELLEGVVFDLIILGLGSDGHTASLFPGSPALEATDLCVRAEGPDHPRLTVTYPVINRSGVALFLVAGEEKAGALARLLEGDPSIPAGRVAAERVVVVADREAARIQPP